MLFLSLYMISYLTDNISSYFKEDIQMKTEKQGSTQQRYKKRYGKYPNGIFL